MANETEILIVNGVEYTLIDSTAVHTVDSGLSTSSSNPVKNSAITAEVNKKPTLLKFGPYTATLTGEYYTFPFSYIDIGGLAVSHDGIAISFSSSSAFRPNSTLIAFKNEASLLNGVNVNSYSGTLSEATAIDSNTFICLLPTSGTSSGGTGYVKAAPKIADAINALDAAIDGLDASKTITVLTETNGVISATASNISIAGSQVTSGTIAEARLPHAYVKKAGDTMTGDLIVPAERIANTYYGITFGRTTSTPVETILYTGIKWVGSAHMPVVHITGYAYGLQSPVEFKIGFYIYSGKIGWQGAVNMGSWNPSIYLFKYARDSVDYVAVGLAGSCYFLQLQADVQDEMGKFANIVTDSSAWSWSFLTETGTIPAADDGTTCVSVPYKADILEAKRHPYWYGTCDTAATAGAKVVTCTDFVLTAGARISVRFTNGSTSTGTMQLNVNDTGAKNCGIYGDSGAWVAYQCYCEKNEVLEFIYDGTYWVVITPYILRNYGPRFSSANISNANGGLQYILATDSMTTGKPPADSHILNMHWDNSTIYAAQFAVAHGTTSMEAGRLWTRGQNGSAAWSSWREIPRLSGALTTGQIVVSDESTGTALLKGVSILPSTSIQATATELGTIATGDYFLFSDQSDNGKIKATLNFDTTKTTEFLRRDGTWAIPGNVILSYGSSTWQDFIDAYDANRVIYCRASSNTDPSSGSQTRMAFMAYVNNETTPGYVEFQYYRSVATHSNKQQGDQVYVYKLDKTAGWTVTVREAYTKIVAGTNMSSSYKNGTLTLNGTNGANYYGVCGTAAATAEKVVACEGFVLKTGVRISIRFTKGSTSTSVMSLNVNDTGAKNCGIYLYNGTWQTYANRCEKNTVLEFVYNGTYWVTITPYALRNYAGYNSRLTSANVSLADFGLQYFLATSAMTTGKPPVDAAILNMNWDNGTIWGHQLAVGNGAGRVFTRAQNGSATWGDWKELPRLSSAPTNGQIIVSDESTSPGLVKGITYDYKLTLSTTFTDVDADTISFSLSNDQLTGLNDYMSSAVSGGYTGMVHVSFTAPLPNSDTHEAVYIAHSALLDEYDMKWVFSGTVYDSVDKTTYPFTFSYPIASAGPVTATVKLNRASSGGSLNPVQDTSVFLSRAVNFGENKYKFPSLVGGTVAWNQLAKEINATNWTGNGTKSFSNGTCSVTFAGQYQKVMCSVPSDFVNGHKYMLGVTVKMDVFPSSYVVRFGCGNPGYSQNANIYFISPPLTNGVFNRKETICQFQANSAVAVGSNKYIFVMDNRTSNWTQIAFKEVVVVDLTLALGPTIADYIYSLEQATTGAGVNWFKQYFPKSYYPYNAGALVSVNPTGAETVGVNQWDEEWEYGEISSTTGANNGSSTAAWRTKNYIPVIPGGTYYVTAPVANKNLKARFYDASKNYIGYTNKAGTDCFTTTAFTVPDNASYVRFGPAVSDIAVPNNNICVSISNPLYNGTYYPYTHHSYPISPVELRGIPKLSDGKFVFDGDVRKSNGEVEVNYKLVAMESLNWHYFGQYAGHHLFYADDLIGEIKLGTRADIVAVSAKYTSYPNEYDSSSGTFTLPDKAFRVRNTDGRLYFNDDSFSTTEAFKTGNTGVYILYKLATPTTESSAALPVPQVVYDGGTESFIDERDVQMPVGQDATYMDATSAISELMDSGLVPSSGGGASSYSEGTFTAKYGTVSNTWNYYKEGNTVTVWGSISNATSMAAAVMTGLPFAARHKQVVSATCSGGSYICVSMDIRIESGSTQFAPSQMTYASTSGTSVQVMNSETMIFYTIGNTATLRFTYICQ